jgi:hypothetical protein
VAREPPEGKENMIKKVVSFFALPFGLFCFHGVLAFFDIYQKYAWMDIPMHFFGGVCITYSFRLALKYFQKQGHLPELNLVFMSIFLLSLAATATVFWEFGEFALDYSFQIHTQAGLEDTMLDMFLGVLGGAVFIIFSEARDTHFVAKSSKDSKKLC